VSGTYIDMSVTSGHVDMTVTSGRVVYERSA